MAFTNVTPRPSKSFDDVAIVNDLMVDVNWRPFGLENLLDGLDRHVDAGTEAAGIGKDDLHFGLMSVSAWRRLRPRIER